MSEIALKIKYNVGSASSPVWQEQNFYDYEIRDVDISAGRDSVIKQLGSGKFKQRVRDSFREIRVTFKLRTTNNSAISTLTKLKNIEYFDGDVYVYPKYIADPDFWIKCIMKKGDVPENMLVAGRHAGNRELTISFLEIEKPVAVIDLGDIYG